MSRMVAMFVVSLVLCWIVSYIGATIFSNRSNVVSSGISNGIASRMAVVMLGTADPAFSDARSLDLTK